MFKLTQNSLLIRFFWGFMSLYLLNCFVDSPDLQPNYFPEDLTYNDPESIIEIVVEKVLGFENAIAEYDDNDSNQNFFGKNTFSLDLFVLPIIAIPINHEYLLLKNQNLEVQNSALLLPYFEIHTPPPEV
ncbi:hypothetical protein [Flavobacterium sp. LB2P44]|uniref:hypothetical protein n=1 Tax=Flavobacterium sp. LB2P44 TaxID=3401713 RepID=UPI003AAC0E0B